MLKDISFALFAVVLLIVLVACSTSTVSPAAQQPPTAAAPTQAPPAPTAAPASPTSKPATATPAPPTATPLPESPPAPELEGGTAWLNSEPLTLAGLRGQVVLLNFWTYGCYNCQNTLPYVKSWWEQYKDQGLIIIGVHTPELAWEYPLENVQAAIAQEGLGWPMVQDNNKVIWRAYKNRYWPRFYLIDHRGSIIYDRIGEGGYATTEQRIVQALAAAANDQP